MRAPRPTPPVIEVDAPLGGAVQGDGPTALETSHPESRPLLTDDQRRRAGRSAFWSSLAILHRRRWLILAVTVLTAIASVVVSLQLPLWFAATTRVLPPEGGSGGGLSALIGDLSPIASSLMGGGGGDYGRYLAILSSRSIQEAAVNRFDLVRVYETEGERDPTGEAIRELMANTDTEVDMETDALDITVLDQDPRRAAQIANFLVSELNRRNEALGLEGASRFRSYVESRYEEIELAMDSSLSAMTAFQERNGVIELPTMAQGLMQAVAQQQAEISRIEVQYEALLSELGPENPQVVAARRALETARQGQSDLLGGREAVMPVATDRLPAVAGEYARLYQEVLIQQALMEEARPLLEQARFDEERERVAVQVVDEAVPPLRKAKPKRAYIVLGATGTALVLSALLVLLIDVWKRRRRSVAEAFEAATLSR